MKSNGWNRHMTSSTFLTTSNISCVGMLLAQYKPSGFFRTKSPWMDNSLKWCSIVQVSKDLGHKLLTLCFLLLDFFSSNLWSPIMVWLLHYGPLFTSCLVPGCCVHCYVTKSITAISEIQIGLLLNQGLDFREKWWQYLQYWALSAKGFSWSWSLLTHEIINNVH